MNEIQQTILDIFREVDAVCDKLNVRYFAIGGTALGAIRHRGFIPWDDDLDIAMPVEDYSRFVVQAQRYLPEHLEIRTFESSGHTQNVFSKVVDTRTTNIEPVEKRYPDSYKGIYVDIMPMSGVPTGIQKNAFISKVALYGAILYGLPWKVNDRSTAKHKALWLLSLPLKPFLSPMTVLKRWEGLLQSVPFDSADYVGYTWWPKLNKLIFPRKWFAESAKLPFEDTEIRMPAGYHEYLSQQFGDYMKLPPVDQRVTHNGFIDLKHSYKDYQRGLLAIPTSFGE